MCCKDDIVTLVMAWCNVFVDSCRCAYIVENGFDLEFETIRDKEQSERRRTTTCQKKEKKIE